MDYQPAPLQVKPAFKTILKNGNLEKPTNHSGNICNVQLPLIFHLRAPHTYTAQHRYYGWTASFLERVRTQSVNTLLGNLVLCDLRFRVVVVEVSTVSTVVSTCREFTTSGRERGGTFVSG